MRARWKYPLESASLITEQRVGRVRFHLQPAMKSTCTCDRNDRIFGASRASGSKMDVTRDALCHAARKIGSYRCNTYLPYETSRDAVRHSHGIILGEESSSIPRDRTRPEHHDLHPSTHCRSRRARDSPLNRAQQPTTTTPRGPPRA